MTTGWLIVNIVLVAVVAAIVAVPAVLIPHLLDREARVQVVKSPRAMRQPTAHGVRFADGQRREVA